MPGHPITAQPEIILGCGSCGGSRDSPGSWIPPWHSGVSGGDSGAHSQTCTTAAGTALSCFHTFPTHPAGLCCEPGAMEPPGSPTPVPGIAQGGMPQHSLPHSIPCPTAFPDLPFRHCSCIQGTAWDLSMGKPQSSKWDIDQVPLWGLVQSGREDGLISDGI